MTEPTAPPVAPRDDVTLTRFGVTRTDPYAWMRDREDPRTIPHIEAENAWTEAQTAHTADLQEALYGEMLGRIQETDLSVPWRKGEWYYYTRTEEGKDYRIYCRKHGSLEAPEQVLIDENALAEGLEFFKLGDFSPSPDHQQIAYTVDTSGGERFTMYVLDLATGDRREVIENIGPAVEWGGDNATVFYVTLDDAWRPCRLFRHALGSDEHELVRFEEDERFFLSVGSSRSERFIVMTLRSSVTTEVWLLEAGAPGGDFFVVAPRRQDVEYSVAHWEDRLFVVTNHEALNGRLAWATLEAPGEWTPILPERKDVQLKYASAFRGHLVLAERAEGLPRLRVVDPRDPAGDGAILEMPEPVYEASMGNNPEYDSATLRFSYSSPVTPSSVFDYDMNTGARERMKETPVPGYDRTKYRCTRVWATARDGAKIPISLVWRGDEDSAEAGTRAGGPRPMFLVGYGSYGYSYPASFVSSKFSLMDRGVVCALAHIRGGSEMGRYWYEDGKYLNKKNTFNDFIDAAAHLVDDGWTTSDTLAIQGGSAGGLLMGAVLNQRPGLFQAALARVPFVDALNTILDPTLPLTVIEWEEWGNPQKEDYFHYMRSYAPYENVSAQDYPHILATSGLNDPRVGYWEPTKWVARLREMKTDSNTLLLKTNMGAGHGGASGRYGYLREIAFQYAFVLDCLGLLDAPLMEG